MECAVTERIKRVGQLDLHETLYIAPFIYDKAGKETLKGIYHEYLTIAEKADLPLLLCTPTWRANQLRVANSGLPKTINRDAVQFMRELCRESGISSKKVKIGGVFAGKNDCYMPEDGLSTQEAERFHQWQIDELTHGGVDYLMAATLPNVDEALGMARAMEKTDLPYIVSFVISRDSRVLDGTSLAAAIKYIDENVSIAPIGYMVNCSHPSFLCAESQPESLFERLIGYQANASALDHCILEEAEQLKVDNVEHWSKLMHEFRNQYGMKILGGCCGTDAEHMKLLAQTESTYI